MCSRKSAKVPDEGCSSNHFWESLLRAQIAADLFEKKELQPTRLPLQQSQGS
jgi:hypothetical protein